MKNHILQFLRKAWNAMLKYYPKLKHLGNRAGSMLVDYALYGVLVAFGVAGIYKAYTRIQAKSWEQNTLTTFNSTMLQLLNCRTAHAGTFPAAATAGSITNPATTTAAKAVSAYVGSTSTDINNWTYQCVSGGTSMIIAIVDNTTPSADAQTILINDIVNTYGSSIASGTATNATTTTITISGTTCS